MTEPTIPESHLPPAQANLAIDDVIKALPQEAIQVDLAMTHCKGSVKKACEVLECTPRELQIRINRYPQLAAKWIRVKGKPLKTKGAFKGDVEVAEEEANKEVEAGLQKQRLMDMGLKEDEASLALSMQNYHTTHQLQSMSILSGGLVKMSMEAMAMVGRLKANPYEDEVAIDGQLLRSGRRETDAMILRALEAYGKKTLEFYSSETMRRKISGEFQQNNAPGKQKAKFGGAPMRTQVLAQPGSNVTLISNPHQHGETKESPDGQG